MPILSLISRIQAASALSFLRNRVSGNAHLFLKGSLARLINNNFQLYALLMFPATFGMILLAYPLNTFFYEPDKLAAKVLIEACLSGLFVGLFMLTSSTFQGMYYNKAAVKFFAIGIVIKFIS